MRIKKYSAGFIAITLAVLGSSFKKGGGNIDSSCYGNYYWFKVSNDVYGSCFEALYFLDYPYDYNCNQYPDELVYGNDSFASNEFGCSNEGDFCCALGYDFWDLELVWPGNWRPKFFASPKCVVFRNE